MFKVAKREVGDVEPLEYYPSDAALTIGQRCHPGQRRQAEQGIFYRASLAYCDGRKK